MNHTSLNCWNKKICDIYHIICFFFRLSMFSNLMNNWLGIHRISVKWFIWQAVKISAQNRCHRWEILALIKRPIFYKRILAPQSINDCFTNLILTLNRIACPCELMNLSWVSSWAKIDERWLQDFLHRTAFCMQRPIWPLLHPHAPRNRQYAPLHIF